MHQTNQTLTNQQRQNRKNAILGLCKEITELAAHLDAGEYRFLVLVEKFCSEKAWKTLGLASCAQWLNWKCGMSMGVAREKVRVAGALPALPKISQAFSEGRVSYSKVRAMTRVATAKNESALLNVALHGTASHVETQVRLYRQVKRREALKLENERHDHRELSWRIDDDGHWNFKGRFSPEQGALIAKAIETAMDANPIAGAASAATDHSDTNHSPIAQRRADALQRIAETYLSNPETTGTSADRFTVNIHTDIETLKEDGSNAESGLEDCCHVSAETSRRIACDAAIVHWLETAEGEPLNVGRKTRTIPPAIRRALQRRDHGCRFPGCTCTRFVDAHHIVHWADGGETRMDNLVLLCRRHHRLVHEGGFSVAMKPGGHTEFTNPDGIAVPHCPEPRSRGNVSDIIRFNRDQGLGISPRTAVPRWGGEKMDHGLAVLGLVQRE